MQHTALGQSSTPHIFTPSPSPSSSPSSSPPPPVLHPLFLLSSPSSSSSSSCPFCLCIHYIDRERPLKLAHPCPLLSCLRIGSLLVYGGVYWFLAAVTYGAFIPSGLFTPSLILGETGLVTCRLNLTPCHVTCHVTSPLVMSPVMSSDPSLILYR